MEDIAAVDIVVHPVQVGHLDQVHLVVHLIQAVHLAGEVLEVVVQEEVLNLRQGRSQEQDPLVLAIAEVRHTIAVLEEAFSEVEVMVLEVVDLEEEDQEDVSK